VWAFAKFGYKDEGLFEAVAAEHVQVARSGDVQVRNRNRASLEEDDITSHY
tara:strand:- start:415 stop:567 length:153 start_codon:yes stop_codon:yes gene_type:complete